MIEALLQVDAVAGLVELLEFCCRQPVFPTAFPGPVAGLPDEGGELVNMLDDSKAQHATSDEATGTGALVIEQVRSRILRGMILNERNFVTHEEEQQLALNNGHRF